jgi:hypothetical protein
MVLTLLLYVTTFNITSIPSQLSAPILQTDLLPSHEEYTADCSCFSQPASQIPNKSCYKSCLPCGLASMGYLHFPITHTEGETLVIKLSKS